jgi:hypothetical protein
MTRIGAIVFIVPFLVLALFQKPKRPGRGVLTLVILASVGVCLGGWSYRNYRLSGYFRPEFMSGLVLQQNYLYSMENEAPPAGFADFKKWNSDEYRSRRFQEIAATQGRYAAVGQMDAEMKAATKSLILEHPLRALKICSQNLTALLLRDYFVFLPYRINPSPWTYSVQMVLFFVYYLVPALLFLGTVTAFVYKKRFTTLAILGYSGMCYVLATAVVWGLNARYVLPVEFTILSVAMSCLISLRERVRRPPPGSRA